MTRNHVPAEFIGLARLFRQRVMAADRDYNASVQRITAPLDRRLKHHKPILSKAMLLDTAHAWSAMPTQYRLALDGSAGSKRRLSITEWRLAATTANNTEWIQPEWEEGVAIVKAVFTTDGTSFDLTTTPHSVVSRHALARWYERSGKRDDQALVADITALLKTNEPDRVRCHSGTWLASVIVAHGDGRAFRVRDVRTFIAGDDAQIHSANTHGVSA